MATLLVSIALVLVVVILETASSSTYWSFQCAAGNFTLGSHYSKNLEVVAAILPTRAGSSPLLFATASVGSYKQGSEVYALAQCWRLSSKLVCEKCVSKAFRDAKKLCWSKEGAVIFRDKCTVGYYNNKIEQFPDDTEMSVVASLVDSTQVVIQGSEFKDGVQRLQEAVVHGAATSTSSYFATGQMELKTIDLRVTLYAAAQCLPSMTDRDCTICLQTVLDTIKLSATPALTPGRAASLWCSYRFAYYRFFNGRPTLTLPKAESPMGSGHPPASKHSVPPWGWVAVGVGAVVCVTVVVVIVVFCYKRISRKNPSFGERERTVQLTGEEAPRVYSEQVESQPSALDRFEEIVLMAKKKEIALFLDYDGTLAPIVSNPERAYMSNEMRGVLQNVANLFRTSVVSGRARDKVFDFVRIKNISYAGSHGTDIKIATSTTEFASTSEIVEEDSYQPAEKYIDMINEVHNFLLNATGEIHGANIEHNKFCVSLHYRNVAEEDLPRIRQVVDGIMENMKDRIDLTKGHMVYDFGPPIKWNKGHAVLYLLDKFGLDDYFPIYIGDDRTDENAFKVLRDRNDGIGILVAETGRETNALYSLKDPAQVMDFLKMLANWKQQT